MTDDKAEGGRRPRREPIVGTSSCAWSGPWCLGDVFEAADDQGGPAGLVAGAEALAGLGVEVLVKEHGVVGVVR